MRDSQLTRQSLKPFSSSIIPDKKKIVTKEDLKNRNYKIDLIKSKCMNIKPKFKKIDSKKTLTSMWMLNNECNDSVDMDSEEMT